MNSEILEKSKRSLRSRIGLLLASAIVGGCESYSALRPTDEAMLANEGAAGASAGEGAAGSAHASAGPDWCEVRAVLVDKCQRCHSDPPAHGAPFPLVTFEDTQRLDSSGNPRSERIAAAVDSDYMPARFVTLKPPVEPLTPDERELVLDWCRSGTPNAGLDCESP